jgi:enoyl-CoA hydratase/carnithine racemase
MNSSLDFELIEKDIALITLNRPELRNVISDDMVDGIEMAVKKVNSEEQIKVVILTGAGKAFCSGGNVKEMHSRAGMFAGNGYDIRRAYQRTIQRIPLALSSLQVPSIAAVNGAAYGAGCDLALMCDMRIAGETATFAESFIKLGLISGDGGAWLLPRLIGPTRAAEMTFTGQAISAQKALEWGMVNKVVENDQVLDEALRMARRIASNPAHAIRMSKQLLQESERASLASMLSMAASLQSLAHHTLDHREAVEAFVDNREPNFTGE